MDHEFDDMQRHLEADRNVLKGVIERVESAVAATSDTPAAEKPTPAPKAEKPAEKAKSTKPPAAVAAKPAAAKQAVVAAVGSGLKGTVSPDARVMLQLTVLVHVLASYGASWGILPQGWIRPT